jgi:hypothetical protein
MKRLTKRKKRRSRDKSGGQAFIVRRLCLLTACYRPPPLLFDRRFLA